ncbi:MAG: DCC1-like thiol-disulfide oxidoreductase family protein [Bryobacterales bacterium]|nr:DCC1-like thiol-disulfide oxidoreductase family protein [Bryobacterales bacterium]
MQTSPSKAAQARYARHLILYDGGCGFCRNAVVAVARLDPAQAFQFTSLDSKLAGELLAERRIAPRGAGTMYVLPNWQHGGQSVLDRASAALFIARGLAWPWKGLTALGVLPQWFLDRCYDAVARNRHRLTRGADACEMPDRTVQDRFVP